MLEVGTYRTVGGELLHYSVDETGKACCEVECADGSVRVGCEVCDPEAFLSDDPAWPWRDTTSLPSLMIVD